MNRKQQMVLVVGFLLILGMFIFPPWRVIYDIPGTPGEKIIGDEYFGAVPKGHIESFGGYKFMLWNGPAISKTITVGDGETLVYMSGRLDYYRLAIQIVGVTLLTGVAYLILRPITR